MAAASPKLEVWVKGEPTTKTLGDCPFCHRVLLTLEEKHVPYTKEYINFTNKPDWLFQVNPAGSVPVAKDLETEQWVVDSGVIADYLESKFPEPALGTAESAPNVGAKIFPAFVAFFKSSPDNKEDAVPKEMELFAALRELEDYLKANGPYVGGQSVCATDMGLAPKLHHMVIALKAWKDWDLPEEFATVKKYLDLVKSRPSWKATEYADQFVVDGWKSKLPA